MESFKAGDPVIVAYAEIDWNGDGEDVTPFQNAPGVFIREATEADTIGADGAWSVVDIGYGDIIVKTENIREA